MFESVCQYWYNLDQVSRAHSLVVVLPFGGWTPVWYPYIIYQTGDSIFVHFRLHFSEGIAQCAWCHHALVCAQMFVYDKIVAILWYLMC